ncbi:MAG: outer membrane protein assembly factor BamA [Elusimicrobia bacterium]|nr:outer membrane protein assembly factor BamA [Elusimicrobiota bacterium]
MTRLRSSPRGLPGVLFVSAFLLFPARRVSAEDLPPTVGEITVEGNRFTKPGAVLSKVKVRKGDVMTDPAFRGDVDRLLESGFYEDVEVAVEDLPGKKDARGAGKVRVTFKIKERPLIRRVDFKGNLKLGESKFREGLVSKPDEPYDRFKAAQDVSKILSVYHEEGYLDAAAESYTSLDPRTNKVILTFFLTDGRRVTVKDVQVAGARAMSEGAVRKVLKNTRKKKVFKEETLKEDVALLVEAYRNKGFLEVAVDDSRREFTPDGNQVTVFISITEGRRYTVGSFSFEGSTLFTESQLKKAVALQPGKLYDQSKMDESLRNLHDLYSDKGFLRAEVTPETKTQPQDGEKGTVDLRFSFVEGSVVYVDRIYIDGNTYTKEKVIRQELLLKPGDVFSATKMRRSIERLYNLGFLEDVQVDVQQPKSPEKADVVFSVKEGKPGTLSAGAGFSSLDGLVGTLQVQHSNVFGYGQHVNVMWEFGRKRQNYELGWTDPWFLGKPMSFGVDLFDTVRTLPFQGDSFAYKKGNRGFGLRAGPRLSDQLSLIENYSYERVRVFDVDPKFVGNLNPAMNITPSDDIKSAVTTGVVLDTRDNVFDANRGGRHSATLEYAGGPLGGDLNFYKPELSVARYFPTFWKFVLTLSARGAYIKTLKNIGGTVAFSELFRIGGVDTVRGYDIGEVGVDGGKAFTVFNAEYKFPIVQENKKTILQGAFFADLGGCWPSVSTIDWSVGTGLLQMKAGVGFGIRFKTPVFPIRLDWGWGLNHRPDQPKSQFYFTIGNIF